MSSTTFFEKGQVGGFFFFKSKSMHLYLPIKVQLSLLYQKYLYTSIKPVLKFKQVENNNLKHILKRKNPQRKKPFFGILKIRGSILLYSKNFFPVFKN